MEIYMRAAHDKNIFTWKICKNESNPWNPLKNSLKNAFFNAKLYLNQCVEGNLLERWDKIYSIQKVRT